MHQALTRDSAPSSDDLRSLRMGHIGVLIVGVLLSAFAFVASRGEAHTADQSPLVVMTAVVGGIAAFLLLVAIPLIHLLVVRRRSDVKPTWERLAMGSGAIWMLSLTVATLGIVSAILWQRFLVSVPFSVGALASVLLSRPPARA